MNIIVHMYIHIYKLNPLPTLLGTSNYNACQIGKDLKN